VNEDDDDDEEDCSSHRAKPKVGRERLRPNRVVRVTRALRMTPINLLVVVALVSPPRLSLPVG
jgi:hypothetical protein